jgi:hypothetical protein
LCKFSGFRSVNIRTVLLDCDAVLSCILCKFSGFRCVNIQTSTGL